MAHVWKSERRAFELLGDLYGAGPFDGACYPVARALQRELGGKLYVMCNTANEAQHAVVATAGYWVWDASGPAAALQMIERFNREEHLVGTSHEIVSMREYAEGDLEDSMHWGSDNQALDAIRREFKRNLWLLAQDQSPPEHQTQLER